MGYGNKSHTTTVANAPASAALAQAITSARKGRTAALREQVSGRLDRRRISRVGFGDTRVFTRRGAPAPDRIRVTILVDASSSMMSSWGRPRTAEPDYRSHAAIAAQTCRDLAGATESLPWVEADVVAFTTGGPGVVLFPLWKTGEPTSDIDAYGEVKMGGTEEGYALAYAFDEMVERLTGREQGLVIIISDGAPTEPAHVKSVIKTMAARNVPTVSVALVDNAIQPQMYGRDNVVVHSGTSRALARGMAKVIGRVL